MSYNRRNAVCKWNLFCWQERTYITSKKKRVEVDEIAKVERGCVEPNSVDEYHKLPMVIPRDCCHNVDSCQLFEIRFYLEVCKVHYQALYLVESHLTNDAYDIRVRQLQ